MQTIRQQIIALLGKREMSARELSKTIRIREKEVYEHLSHITHTVAAQKKRLIVNPSCCLLCGYIFENRRRFTRPGRCPRCKNSHIKEPTYRIT